MISRLRTGGWLKQTEMLVSVLVHLLQERSPAQVPPEAVTVWGQKNSLTDGGVMVRPILSIGTAKCSERICRILIKKGFLSRQLWFSPF